MTIETLSAEIVRVVRDSMQDSPLNQSDSVAGLIAPFVASQRREAELAAFKKFGNECLRNIYNLENGS